MRKNQKLIRAIVGVTQALPAIALVAASQTASATTYIYEPFDYSSPAPPSPLLGKTDVYVTPNRPWLQATNNATAAA